MSRGAQNISDATARQCGERFERSPQIGIAQDETSSNLLRSPEPFTALQSWRHRDSEGGVVFKTPPLVGSSSTPTKVRIPTSTQIQFNLTI